MFILDPNFWTWNPSKLSKVSKDLDLSLLSNKSLSNIIPSSTLGPELDEVGQRGLVHWWHHSQKIWNPKPKNFFCMADSKTCRIFWGFKLLSSAVVPKLWYTKAFKVVHEWTYFLCFFAKNIFTAAIFACRVLLINSESCVADSTCCFL